jgi:ankyrin repeat protein
MKVKNNELSELVKKEININFAFACLNGDIDAVKENINDEYIDNLGYEKGMFGIYAAMNGHKEILELLYQHPKSDEIKQYQHSMLNVAASYGKVECVKFFLNVGSNPLELLNTTAYNNYDDVKIVLDEYIAEHDVKTTGDIIHTEAY